MTTALSLLGRTLRSPSTFPHPQPIPHKQPTHNPPTHVLVTHSENNPPLHNPHHAQPTTHTQEQTKIEWIHISHNTSLSLLGITVSISTLQPIILTKKTIHYRPQFPVLLPLLCQNHHFVLWLCSHLNS